MILDMEGFENPESENIAERVALKYPKFKAAIYAMTAALMLGGEPSRDASIETGERTETLDTIAQKADPHFREVAQSIVGEIKNFSSEQPTNNTYIHRLNYVSVGSLKAYEEQSKGELGDEGENMLVGSDSTSRLYGGSYVDGTNENKIMIDGLSSNFYISAANGELNEGGKITMRGEGESKVEAIQNALESGINFLGTKVETATHSNKKTAMSPSLEVDESLNEVVTTRGSEFVKHYKVTAVHGGDGRPFTVSVDMIVGVPEKK